MNETEEQIRQTVERLTQRQNELAEEYNMVSEAITSLERLLTGGETRAESGASVPSPESTVPPVPPKGPETRLPKFNATAFFDLTQKEAVVKVLRAAGKALTMLQILEILKDANYPFKSKMPYQSLHPMMRKGPEFVQHGSLWGLRKTGPSSGSSLNGSGKSGDDGEAADRDRAGD